MSSTLVRWGGLAAAAAGVLLAAKGAAIILSDADPSFVPPATLLFSLGMVALHARLEGNGGPLGTVGAILAWVALAASLVNLIGLLALGIAALRARVMPAPRSAVPLAVGVLWFPLQGVGFAISDGVGLVLGGLAWMPVGYVLWSRSATPTERPSRVR